MARVLTWMLAGTLAACAGRPSAPPSSNMATAGKAIASKRQPRPLVGLLMPPYGFERVDATTAIEQLDDAWLPVATMPSDPIVAAPRRPPTADDALELADLALSRGDAYDASVQYRALLSTVEPPARAYAQLQLARAYAILGDQGGAHHLLRSVVAGGGPLAWPALVELATLRAAEVGALEALRDLETVARGRHEALVDHMIHASPDEEAAVLLFDKAERLGRCDYAFQAIQVYPRLTASAAPGSCWREIEKEREAAVLRAQSRRVFAESWIVLAEDAIELRRAAVAVERGSIVHEAVRGALHVTIELSLARAPIDESVLPRIRAVAALLPEYDRRSVVTHIDTLLRVYGER